MTAKSPSDLPMVVPVELVKYIRTCGRSGRKRPKGWFDEGAMAGKPNLRGHMTNEVANEISSPKKHVYIYSIKIQDRCILSYTM